jgi:hypothetical protein
MEKQPMMGLDRELEYSTTRPERKKDDGTLLDSNEYLYPGVTLDRVGRWTMINNYDDDDDDDDDHDDDDLFYSIS